jgi:hypothetical protein
MTETTTERPAADVLTPGPDDKKTRRTDQVTADPEAPYGWMIDPKTKERRPKKRPGKQSRSEQAPPTRPANRARSEPPPAGSGDSLKDYSGPVSELCQGVWMVLAAVPDVNFKLGKIDMHEVGVKAKAQAAVLKENGDGVIKGVNMIAQHNATFRAGLDKAAADAGPLWVLPAMFVLMPFVGQSLAMWRAPVEGDVALLAKKTERDFDDLMNTTMREAAAEQASYEEAEAARAAEERERAEAADINSRAS